MPGPLAHRYAFAALDGADVAHAHELAGRLRDVAHVVIIAPRATLAELIGYLGERRINHVLVGDEAEVAAGVEVTARKLLSGDIFGIEQYLPAGVAPEMLRLRDFEGRGRALDTVLAFAEAARMRRQVRTAIGQVCEELLMNALYDAPVGPDGQPVFAEVDPRERIRARSPRPVSIRYAATDSQFVVAVRDRFGLLAKNTIVAYIDKCLRSPEQIDRKTYGAGLGLYLVANAAAAYVVNVAHGVATEVVCTFDRGAKAPLRQVGLFVHPGGAEHLQHGPTPASANARAASEGVG
ncbi:MAG: hypothetical protein R2939_15620 [Kofleriaceae bacterium]